MPRRSGVTGSGQEWIESSAQRPPRAVRWALLSGGALRKGVGLAPTQVSTSLGAMSGVDGICHFYSETGTEGGYWAFYDPSFSRRNDSARHCRRCGSVADPSVGPGALLRVERTYDMAAMANPDWEEPPLCAPGAHDWQPMYPDGVWDYDGLHVLATGDQLTIFDKAQPERIVWQGRIDLTADTVFSDGAFGYWIHNRQRGVDLERWARYFLEEYPARLERRAGPV